MLERYCVVIVWKRNQEKRSVITISASMLFRVVQEATGQKPESEPKPLSTESKNPNAVALGRLGGLKGGKVRKEKLSPEQRKDIARKAAQAGVINKDSTGQGAAS